MNIGSFKYSRADNLVTRKVAGETIIVPIENAVGDLCCIFTLNSTGTRIWDMLGAAVSEYSIVRSVCEEFEVTPGEAEKDLKEFLDSLLDAGLLRACQLS